MSLTFKTNITCAWRDHHGADGSIKSEYLTDRLMHATAEAIVENYEEAQRIAGLFPKSCKVSASSEYQGRGFVTIAANLCANGVNGGVNEGGIKRIRSFIKACRKLGFSLEQGRSFGNSVARDLDTL